MSLQRGERHRGRRTQIPKLEHRVAIVRRGRQQVQSLRRVPCHVGHRRPGAFTSQLAPCLVLLEVPNDHGAIAGGRGQNVRYLRIPAQAGDLGRLLLGAPALIRVTLGLAGSDRSVMITSPSLPPVANSMGLCGLKAMADTAPPLCSEMVEMRATSDDPAPSPGRRAEGSKMQMEPSVIPPAMIPLPLPALPADQSMEENRLAVLTLPKTLGVGLSSGLVMLKLYSSSSPP